MTRDTEKAYEIIARNLASEENIVEIADVDRRIKEIYETEIPSVMKEKGGVYFNVDPVMAVEDFWNTHLLHKFKGEINNMLKTHVKIEEIIVKKYPRWELVTMVGGKCKSICDDRLDNLDITDDETDSIVEDISRGTTENFKLNVPMRTELLVVGLTLNVDGTINTMNIEQFKNFIEENTIEIEGNIIKVTKSLKTGYKLVSNIPYGDLKKYITYCEDIKKNEDGSVIVCDEKHGTDRVISPIDGRSQRIKGVFETAVVVPNKCMEGKEGKCIRLSVDTSLCTTTEAEVTPMFASEAATHSVEDLQAITNAVLEKVPESIRSQGTKAIIEFIKDIL